QRLAGPAHRGDRGASRRRQQPGRTGARHRGAFLRYSTRVTHFEQKQLTDSSLHVAISGKIDETFDATPILAVKNAPKVVLHLGGVRSVSSLGVRAFEAFIAALGKREVVLIHVSAAVASQLTMIPNLCQGARVESAKLPFACPACGTEKLHSV